MTASAAYGWLGAQNRDRYRKGNPVAKTYVLPPAIEQQFGLGDTERREIEDELRDAKTDADRLRDMLETVARHFPLALTRLHRAQLADTRQNVAFEAWVATVCSINADRKDQ